MIHCPEQRNLVIDAVLPLRLALNESLEEDLSRHVLSITNPLYLVNSGGASFAYLGNYLVLLMKSELADRICQFFEPQFEDAWKLEVKPNSLTLGIDE